MLRSFLGLVVVALHLAGCADEAEPLLSIEETILKAGNSASESERYQLLAELAERGDLEERFKVDLVLLLRAIDRYANGLEKYWEPGDQEMAGEDGYLGGFFVLDVWPIDDGYPHRVDEDSPLFALRSLYRARMLVWNAVEMGILQESCFEEAEALFRVAAEAFPDNPIIPMYLGEETPWRDLYEAQSGAPKWATLQREALGKLKSVIQFWIRERQAPDGQFGGGWGDDIEMWRRWVPLLIGFQDTELETAHRRLTEGIYELPRLAGGYSTVETDVEHSAEDSADSVTSMLYIEPENELWASRAFQLGDLMEDVWAAENDRGFWQFKSTYMTSSAVSSQTRYACDTPYHTRALQPLFLYWQRTNDPVAGERLIRWMDTWVDAALQTNRDKPAGVPPAAIAFPSGVTAGSSGPWYEPGCHITNDLFVYPRGMSLLLRAMALTYLQTDESKYLDAIRRLASLRREAIASSPDLDLVEGSELWAGYEARSSLRAVMGKLRLVLGTTEFDDLLLVEGEALDQYRISGEVEVVERVLESSLTTLRLHEPMFTSEVRFTDRVFSFHRKFLNAHFGTDYPSIDFDLLYNMVSGDSGDPLMMSMAAVRWLHPADDWGIWVKVNEDNSFEASVYNFASGSRELAGKLLRLELGEYESILSCEGLQPSVSEYVVDSERVAAIQIPPQALCRWSLTRSR